MGYGGSIETAGRTLGRSGDDGVDAVIDQDSLGLDRVYIQAKRYAKGDDIGNSWLDGTATFGSRDRENRSGFCGARS
jgi:restriction system protein